MALLGNFPSLGCSRNGHVLDHFQKQRPFCLKSLHFGARLNVTTMCSKVQHSENNIISLPPSPASLPVIGHFHHLVGGIPHQMLSRLAQVHGPIFSLNLGSMKVLVVSDAETAKEVLKTKDSIFASRPTITLAKNILYNCQDMVFGAYTDKLKETKKFLLTELLSSKKLNIFATTKNEEVSWLVQTLAKSSNEGEKITVRDHLIGLSSNIITRIVMGKRYHGVSAEDNVAVAAGEKFRKVVDDAIKLGITGSVADFFPWLEFLDWQIPESKRIHQVMDEFMQQIIDEHRQEQMQKKIDQPRDFLDIMLTAPCFENDDRIKALLLDIIIGATDTSSTTLEWALAEIVRHPRVLRKAKEEIDFAVGSNTRIQEHDIINMPYIQAIVKEVFRLHPPIPLLIPHLSYKDCMVKGYSVPAGTMLFVNLYHMGRDPKVWTDALKFKPERFLEKDVDIMGQDFELIPFGSGRRACPGSALGLSSLHLALATLLHCFDWKEDANVDMSEQYGATNLIKVPLQVVITPTAQLERLYTTNMATSPSTESKCLRPKG